MRSFSILLILALSAGAAYAQLAMTGAGITGGSAPPSTGKILLVDGASFILQTDAASKVCRAGGC